MQQKANMHVYAQYAIVRWTQNRNVSFMFYVSCFVNGWNVWPRHTNICYKGTPFVIAVAIAAAAEQNTTGSCHRHIQDCVYTGFYAVTLLLEVGWLQRVYHYTAVWMKKSVSKLRQLRHGQQGYEQTETNSAAEDAEDEDVQEERLAVQAGDALPSSSCPSDCLLPPPPPRTNPRCLAYGCILVSASCEKRLKSSHVQICAGGPVPEIVSG